jgi:hypothetical protein
MSVTTRVIDVDNLPTISNRTFLPEDRYVAEVDIGGSNPIYWWAIVHRPSTNEYFRVHSWDGENGGYFPDIPHDKLPDGVVLNKKLRAA